MPDAGGAVPCALPPQQRRQLRGSCRAGGQGGGGHDNVVLITLGTGVGGGIIIGGKIYDGMRGAGAELGHTLLVLDGEPCTCGRRGCWEAYSSATALIRQARQAAAEHPESLLAGGGGDHRKDRV